MLVLGCIFNQDGAFFEWQTHRAVLREISVVGILACGMTLVIITAGIDLSVGSVLGVERGELRAVHDVAAIVSAALAVPAVF